MNDKEISELITANNAQITSLLRLKQLVKRRDVIDVEIDFVVNSLSLCHKLDRKLKEQTWVNFTTTAWQVVKTMLYCK